MSQGKKKILQEVALFAILMVLIIAQVMVYRFDEGRKRYGLSYDHAKLVFTNDLSTSEESITVYALSSNCYKCNPMEIGTVGPGENMTYKAEISFPMKIILRNSTNTCDHTYHFREYGLYVFSVSELNCIAAIEDKGDDAYLPILYAAIVLGILSIAWIAVTLFYKFFGKKYFSKNESGNESIQTNTESDPYESKAKSDPVIPVMYGSVEQKKEGKGKREESSGGSPNLKSRLITKGTSDDSSNLTNPVNRSPVKPKRLVSLDTFRGFSLLIMVFINYGGGGYYFFQHSKWNGLTVADLVFPWFVWIMGVSVVFSFQGRKKDSFLHQLYQIIRRTVLLFALGLFLISNNSDTPLSQLRICGVLQRLSFTYLIVALTELFTNHLYQRKNFTLWNPLKDITNNWVQWVMVLLLEALWLMLTFLVTAKGCPRGYLGPGGRLAGGNLSNCTGGAARVIDYWILGEEHLYPRNTAKDLYQLELRFEPEGILGTLNSIVLCYLGVQAGKTLLHFKGWHRSIIFRFIAWGMALSALATLLCLGQKNGGIIPINKNMWSLSYILLMAGFGYLVLATFYLMIDVLPVWNGAPFKYAGMNSILLYLGHEILHHYFPFSVYDQDHSHLTYLAANLIALSVWSLITYYWYWSGFFLKI